MITKIKNNGYTKLYSPHKIIGMVSKTGEDVPTKVEVKPNIIHPYK